MRYQIPQFIDVEDKIFGPFSFKQFLYLIGGGGISYVLWKVLPTVFAILAITPILAFSIALAFAQVNNRPFIYIVQAFFNYLVHPKMYFWKRKSLEDLKQEYEAELKKRAEEKKIHRESPEEKIQTLSEKLDILERTQNR